LKGRFSYSSVSWDLYSVAAIFLAFVFVLLNWESFPRFVDVFHYLLSAVGYEKAGGYVAHAFWEYAPVGRPNIYPPLVGISLWGINALSCSRLFSIQLVSAATPVVFLFFCWLAVRRLFDKRTAFWAVLFIFACPSFYASLSNNISGSWAILFCLWGYVYLREKRNIWAVIFLTIGAYTHHFVSWIFTAAVLLEAFLGLKDKKDYLATLAFVFILAAPLWIFQISSLKYVRTIRPLENMFIEIKPLIYILSAIGAWYLIKKKRDTFFIAAAFLSLGLLCCYVYRFFSAQGLFFFVILAAVGFNWVFSRVEALKIRPQRLIPVFLIFVLFLSLISPTILIDRMQHRIDLYMMDSVLGEDIFLQASKRIYKECFVRRPILELAEFVEKNTKDTDIIYSNAYMMAVGLGALSGRVTSSALAREVKPYRGFDSIGSSRIIAWFKFAEVLYKKEDAAFKGVVSRYRLRKLKETPVAYIMENSSARAKLTIPSAILDSRSILAIFVCLILGFLFSGYYYKKRA